MTSEDSKRSAGGKVQGYVSSYHKFVIASLVGVEGTSESDVVARIIGYWIKDSEAWLSARGITYEEWRLSHGAPDEKEGKLLQVSSRMKK